MIDYSGLREKINPDRDGQDVLQLRTATVSAIGTNGKVSITLNGVTVTDVPYLVSSGIVVGTVVQVLVYRGSLLVIGAAAGSTQSIGGAWHDEMTADGSANTSATGVAYMDVTLPGPGTYAFHGQWIYTTATNSIQMGFTLGGTSTPSSYRYSTQVVPNSSTTGQEAGHTTGTSYPTNVQGLTGGAIPVNGQVGSVIFHGRVTVTAGGTLTFRFGRASGTGSVTLRTGSNVTVQAVNLA